MPVLWRVSRRIQQTWFEASEQKMVLCHTKLGHRTTVSWADSPSACVVESSLQARDQGDYHYGRFNCHDSLHVPRYLRLSATARPAYGAGDVG